MTLWIKSNKEHRKKTLLERTDYSCFSLSSNNIPDREKALNACVRNQHLLSLIKNNYLIWLWYFLPQYQLEIPHIFLSNDTQTFLTALVKNVHPFAKKLLLKYRKLWSGKPNSGFQYHLCAQGTYTQFPPFFSKSIGFNWKKTENTTCDPRSLHFYPRLQNTKGYIPEVLFPVFP